MAKLVMRYCVSHGIEIDIKNFNVSKNINHGGYLPYCKDCCNDIFKGNLRKMKTAEGAMYVTCAEMGVPFIREVYDKFTKEYDSKKYNYTFGGYYNKLNTQRIVQDWDGFSDTDVDFKDLCELSHLKEIAKTETKKLTLEWGERTKEEYEILIYLFEKYTKDIVFESPQQEDLYRDLCMARLEMRKISNKDSDEDMTKVQNRYLNILNKLKIDDFEGSKKKSLSEQLIFQKITEINENDVEDIYKEPKKYSDFNKLKSYMKDLCLRPLGNMLVGHRDFNISLDDIERYNLDD